MAEGNSLSQIEAAKNGSEVELAAIIAQFMPFIQYMAKRFAAPGLDVDDAVQEGIIGLFSAIQSYSPGKLAVFKTYAQVCIQNAIFTAKKAAGRKKHLPLNHSIPIPEQHSTPGPEEKAIADEQMRFAVEKMRRLLSPLEKRVLRLHLGGMCYSQIARRIGKNERAVGNALARVRRKLR